MKLTIESTGTCLTLDGVPVRLWEGVTEGGVPCRVFVHLIGTREEADQSEFEAELEEQAHPFLVLPLEPAL